MKSLRKLAPVLGLFALVACPGQPNQAEQELLGCRDRFAQIGTDDAAKLVGDACRSILEAAGDIPSSEGPEPPELPKCEDAIATDSSGNECDPDDVFTTAGRVLGCTMPECE